MLVNSNFSVLVMFGNVGFSLVCGKTSMNAGIRQRFCYYIIAGNAVQEVQPCLHALGNALLVAVSCFATLTLYC